MRSTWLAILVQVAKCITSYVFYRMPVTCEKGVGEVVIFGMICVYICIVIPK